MDLLLPVGQAACYSFFVPTNFAASPEQSKLSFNRTKMAIATPQSPIVTATPGSTEKRAMTMATTLFFMWGFLTALNGILVPHLKNIFDLTYAEVMLMQFSFFSAYFFFSIPSCKRIEWIGYERSMVAGLFTMGFGALLFIPAASVPSFPLFLAALIVLAAGITVLQVSANPIRWVRLLHRISVVPLS